MPFISFTVTGLNESVAGINQVINSGLPTAKRNSLNQTADFFVFELKRNSHVISGKMRDSVRSQPVTDMQMLVEVGAPYAAYENRRKGSKGALGPHNFADRAEQATKAKMGNIITSEYSKVFNTI